MPKVRVLSEEVANQIAAGEVVERPASVVKELAENALDAGATRIDIEIRQGGLEQIVVSDNGCGLAPDDLVLAFQRHATSKLRQAEDLFGISTLGFRGEALPSIASVAKVLVKTRERDSANGWSLAILAGEQNGPEPCGAPIGTTITVDSLFYNTPARRQFMKSPVAEAGRIRELIAHMALAAPQVAWRLMQDDRIVLETTGNDQLQDAVLAIYGREVAEQLIPVEGGGTPVSIRGLVSRPELTRNNRRDQVFILNDRLVQCRSLSVVLAEAYRSLLPAGRHPLAFLHLTLPPETVDVNVHPAKTEIRLREERQVAAVLHRVLRQTLEATGQVQAAASVPLERLAAAQSVRETSASSLTSWAQPRLEPSVGRDCHEEPQVPISLQQMKQQLLGLEPSPWTAARPTIPAPTVAPHAAGEQPIPTMATAPDRDTMSDAYRLLGQVLASYLVVERSDGVWLVDQHAAHERIVYEQLSGQAARSAAHTTQQLLVPYTLQLGPRETAVLEASVAELATLGFDLQHFGGQTWLLRSLPTVYRGRFRPEQFADLVSELAEDYRGDKQLDRREQILIRLACQSAIKAGQRMQHAEMVELLDQLWQTRLPFTCPHGRPTAIKFGQDQLFRLFHP